MTDPSPPRRVLLLSPQPFFKWRGSPIRVALDAHYTADIFRGRLSACYAALHAPRRHPALAHASLLLSIVVSRELELLKALLAGG